MGSKGTVGSQKGFSMVELVIALTVTLIVSGAVYQLVTAGQSAFRREPAMAHRQQSVRMAIDIISQDLYRAGYGLPDFAQVFTEDLDAVGPVGPTGAATDELEIFAATECPFLTICEVNGVSLTTVQPISNCYNLPSMVILANATEWYPYWAEAPGGASNNSCPAGSGSNGGGNSGGGNSGGGNSGGGNSGGGNSASFDAAGSNAVMNASYTRRESGAVIHAVISGSRRPSAVIPTANNSSRNGHINFPAGKSVYNNPGGPNQAFNNPPEWILVGQVIRYRIRVDADGTPNLERSAFGGNNYPDGSSSWEIIAIGVEDLQVQYLNGTGWQDTPGAVGCAVSCATPAPTDFDTVIRRVKITLSARALAANLQGQSTSAVGDAVRGQLTTEIAPRPAVLTLGIQAGDY